MMMIVYDDDNDDDNDDDHAGGEQHLSCSYMILVMIEIPQDYIQDRKCYK